MSKTRRFKFELPDIPDWFSATFLILAGYGLIQGTFYGVWAINDSPKGIGSMIAWGPTAGLGLALFICGLTRWGKL